MVSPLDTVFARRPDVLFRNGESHSDAIPCAVADHTAGSSGQSVPSGFFVDLHRSLAGISNLYGRRRGCGRITADRAADGDTRSADLSRQLDSGFRAEYDV